jgi:hypothetical protein
MAWKENIKGRGSNDRKLCLRYKAEPSLYEMRCLRKCGGKMTEERGEKEKQDQEIMTHAMETGR